MVWNPSDIEGYPKTALLASLPEDLNGNRGKKRAEISENCWQAFSISHCFSDVNQPSDRPASRSVFEDMFEWRYASIQCLRPAAGAELSWWVLTSLSILLPRA